MIILDSLILLMTSLVFWAPLSHYTTFGNKDWFLTWLYKYTVKMEMSFERKDRLQTIFEGKAFTCRPCHTAWLTIFCGTYFMLWTTPIVAFITYKIAKYRYNDK